MMKLDPAATVFEVTESDVLVVYQSRLAVSIALEGERSQSCEAFVCGGKSGNDQWVAAVVFLSLTRRSLVYRHGRIGKGKGAFDAALQEALDFVIPLGFELDSVNLNYSPAMRQVVLQGIRGLQLAGGKGSGKKHPPQESRQSLTNGAMAHPVAEPAGEDPPTAPVAGPSPAVVEGAAVQGTSVAAVAKNDETAAVRMALLQVQQEKAVAEAAVAELANKLEREVQAAITSQQAQAAAEATLAELDKKHQAELAALRLELKTKEGHLSAAIEDQGKAETDSKGAIRRESELQEVIVGLKAELKAMREETEKAMRQASQAEAAVKQARTETEKSRKERDGMADAAEKERTTARAEQARLKAELAQARELAERQAAELAQVKTAASKEEAAARRKVADLAAELKQVKTEQSEALVNNQESLALSLAEQDRLRHELTVLQDDLARITAEEGEARGLLANRAQTAEAEADRLMQSLVDAESSWSARVQAQEAAMAERVAVLKGVIEQLWPVDGMSCAAITPSELARIAAAPLRMSTAAATTGGGEGATSPVATKARQPRPIVILEEFTEPLAEPAVATAAPVIATAATPSTAARFDIDTYSPAPAREQTNGDVSAPISISFDDEDWGDLDLSGGDDYGDPVSFHHQPSLAGWVVNAAKVRELLVSVNVQRVAPPGGGPGTYKAFICLVEQEQGEEGCFVVLEQDDATVRLVYVPEYDAPVKKLLHDAQFFVESIGFMMLAVDTHGDSAKRSSALEKCRSFIRY